MPASLLDTRLCADLGLDVPVVAFTHCKEVAAAVTNAGGMGVLGAARYTAEGFDEALTWLDSACGGRPYGANVLLANADGRPASELAAEIPDEHRAFVAGLAERWGVQPTASSSYALGLVATPAIGHDQVEAALRHPVAALSFGLGVGSELAGRVKDHGVKVITAAGSVRHALVGQAAGADYIVAQGTEAAGHTGQIGALALIPQVVDAVGDIPVLAAGGITDGRQLMAARALGAVGVWTGTMWLVSAESEIDDIIVDKLIAADASEVRITRSSTGKPSRQLRTEWTEAWLDPQAPPVLPYPLQGLLVGEVVNGFHEQRISAGMGTPAGQGVGMITQARRSCADIMSTFVDQATRAADGLAS